MPKYGDCDNCGPNSPLDAEGCCSVCAFCADPGEEGAPPPAYHFNITEPGNYTVQVSRVETDEDGRLHVFAQVIQKD